MQQAQALDILKMGKNVFLTGAAGAGKSYVLNQYIKYLKENEIRHATTASTGIAATHINGITLHSFSGIGVLKNLDAKSLHKITTNDRIKKNFKRNQVLIVDEISMLTKNQLDMVDEIARTIRDNEEIFGGMQIVLCGDFFQLPPIVRPNIEANNNDLYYQDYKPPEKEFAFESRIFTQDKLKICYLTEQHRQKNDPLLQVLNDIREGIAGEQTKVPLRTRYKKEPEGHTKATKLYSKNINVDAINNAELARLSSKEQNYVMDSSGFSLYVDNLKRNCMALENLVLKIGAEVMFIKNEKTGRYVNGTRGVVVGFTKADGYPVVKTYDGDIVTAVKEEWNFEENNIVRASIMQVPLRLAWAITIHKSQGMTLDTAEMDLSDTFELGMGYVALSRVKKLNGLKLLGLNEIALKVDPLVLEFDKVLRQKSENLAAELAKISSEEIAGIQQISAANSGHTKREKTAKPGRVRADRKDKAKAAGEKKPNTYEVTLGLLKQKLNIAAICKERTLAESTVASHIESLVSKKRITLAEIEYLKSDINPDDFSIILDEFKKSDDGKMTPIYEKFAGKYSYRQLQVARIFAFAKG